MTKVNQKPKVKRRKRDDENSMWSWFEDFVIDGDLFSFTDHAGIKLEDVPPEKVWDVFRDHYTRSGAIDIHKFATDVATWGRIASRVVELQLERSRSARRA
ncbi:hypothetical protein [Bradyrhizobium sp.]|uniref:hypothetical protein n=1 Tax=Bradyrhizobium sp. TaxID=376 RepID=UPI0025C09477|nr:hypothetical protein [Bradyrhizobium sp.]